MSTHYIGLKLGSTNTSIFKPGNGLVLKEASLIAMPTNPKNKEVYAMAKITKAVIPAAGLGTRMLPIARTVPKEMLPIVDRPSMEYLIREAVESGITDILIINGRNKGVIEDYFDYSVEYDNNLRMKKKEKELADAITNQEFEKAAVIRDKIRDLKDGKNKEM